MIFADYIARALAEREGDAPAAERPEQRERVVHEPPEAEHCGHCEGWHDPAVLCPEARWDAEVEAAYDLIAMLRERGITLRLAGDRVHVHGGEVTAETLEKLKSIKGAIVTILRSEG